MIPLSTPHLAGNEWKYLKECLDTQWVSSVGPFVDRFEKEVAQYTGAAHAVAVVNGTAALHTALKVVGVQPEDEVLVSDLTFIAPVNAILYCNAHPVFMDADKRWQMDPEKVESFLDTECEIGDDGLCRNKTSRRIVRAIVPVHILGFAAEIDKLVDIARRFNLKVVEDAAEGMGVRFKGQHVGTFGDIGIFSFNGNKIITCGGGGMMVTHNASYAERARYLTTQAKDDPVEFYHKEMGYNYRLTNVQAALGVAQLEQLDGFIQTKRRIAENYHQALKDTAILATPVVPGDTDPTYWMYVVLLDPEKSGCGRRDIVNKLIDRGVQVRPFWQPAHSLPYLGKYRAYRIERATRLYDRGICLPGSVHLSREDQNRVCRILKDSIL